MLRQLRTYYRPPVSAEIALAVGVTSARDKVEKWTRDGTKVDSLLYAGNSLGRARAVFESAIKHRPWIRLTLREL
jgi:thiamine monophosphate kinase